MNYKHYFSILCFLFLHQIAQSQTTGEVYYLYPTPGELIAVIDEGQLSFESSLLNPTDNLPKYIDTKSRNLNLGIYMIEKSFMFGGWYRNNIDFRPDAIIALAGFAKEKFQVGYSFDLTLSKLSNYSYGSHEISLTLFLGQKSEIPIRKKLLIPMI